MRSNAGFTLLEILVAIALASLVLTSIYGVFTSVSDAQQTVEKRGEALHLGRVLIARLDRELLGLSLGNQYNQAATLAGGKNAQGESYLEILTHTSAWDNGLRQVRYRFGRDPDGQLTLWRMEKNANNPYDVREEGLSRGIEELTFRFFDGREWREDWSSLSNGRPILVRLDLKAQDSADLPPLVGTFDLPQER